MDKHHIIRALGRFPDKVLEETQMLSKNWKCSSCQQNYQFLILTKIPAPCNFCGGIFFEKQDNELYGTCGFCNNDGEITKDPDGR